MVDPRKLEEALARRGLGPLQPTTGGVPQSNPRLAQPEPVPEPPEDEEGDGGGGAAGRLLGVLTSGRDLAGAVSGGRLRFGDDPLFFDEIADFLLSPVSLAAVASEVVAPGNPFGTGALLSRGSLLAGTATRTGGLASRIGTAVAAEAAVGGAAVGAAKIAERAIPEDAPGILRVGGALAGGALGATGAIRGLRAGLKVPPRTIANITSWGLEQNVDPKTLGALQRLDQAAPGLRSNSRNYADLSEDTLWAADDMIAAMAKSEGADNIAEAFVLMSAHGDQLRTSLLTGRPVMEALGRTPIIKHIIRPIAPVTQESHAVQAALRQRSAALAAVETPMYVNMIKARRGIESALEGTAFKFDEMFDVDGRVLEGIISYTGDASNPAKGLARHIFQNPDDYKFINADLKKAVADAGNAVNVLGPLKRFAGARFDDIEDFFGTQRWRQSSEELEELVRSGVFPNLRYAANKRLIGEKGLRSFTLEEGIKAGLEPITDDFLGVMGKEYLDLARKFADFEAERVATLFVDEFSGLRGTEYAKRSLSTLKKEGAAMSREEKSIRASLTGAIPKLTRASGKAEGKVGSTAAGVAREKAVLSKRQAIASFRAEKADMRTARLVASAEARLKAIREIRNDIFSVLKGTVKTGNTASIRITRARTELARLQRTIEAAGIKKAETNLATLVNKVYKKEISAQAALKKAESILDNVIEEVDSPNLRSAILRADAAKSSARRYKDYEAALRGAIKRGEAYPSELVPANFGDGKIRALHERLLNNINDQNTIKAQVDVMAGKLASPAIDAKAETARQAIRSKIIALDSADDSLATIGSLADSVREMVLTADLSAIGIQGLVRFIENPLQGSRDIYRAIRFVLSPEGFQTWWMQNADEIADARRHGLTMTRHTPSEISAGALGKLKNVRRPLIEKVPVAGSRLRALNDAMYGRGVAYLKFQSWKTNVQMLEQSRSAPGWRQAVQKATGFRSVDESWDNPSIKRLTSDYVNNVFGGLDPSRVGIGRNQRALEKVFVLTPDFLRSTVGTAASSTRNTPEGILARTFLMKGFMMAAGLATTFSLISGEQANILHPDRKDWLFFKIPTPDGGLLTVNPFGRFRTLFRTVTVGPAAALGGETVEASLDRSLDSFGRFSQGRIATVPGIALNLVGDKDFFGNPIRSQGGFPGRMEQAQFAARQLLPIFAQGVTEEGFGFQSVPEILGISGFPAEHQELQALRVLSAAAIEAGLPPDAVKSQVSQGRNPLNATDSDGARILTDDERNAAIERAVEESGIERERLFRLGRDEQVLSLEAQKGAQSNAESAFFSLNQQIKDDYTGLRNQIEQQLQGPTPDYAAYSRGLSALREQRRSRYSLIYNSDEYAPIIEGFNTPDKIRRKNAEDVLFDQYKAIVNNPEFTTIGPEGEEFDFEAQDALIEELRNDPLFGPFVEEFESRQNDGKSAIELERDLAFQETLTPYWDARSDAWAQINGERFAESFEAYEAENIGNPNFSRDPVARFYRRVLTQKRDILRLKNPEIDAAVVKWLGFTPVRLRRR